MTFLQTTDHEVAVWWTAAPVRAPLLVAWSGGPPGRALSEHPLAEREARVLAALARQLGMSIRRLERALLECWTHDWEHDPFARGAYSYPLVGGSDAARTLARPIARTLYFAGEAVAPEARWGTVHGAIASGRHAAAALLRAR
jgi:monoamine oxidase